MLALGAEDRNRVRRRCVSRPARRVRESGGDYQDYRRRHRAFWMPVDPAICCDRQRNGVPVLGAPGWPFAVEKRF